MTSHHLTIDHHLTLTVNSGHWPDTNRKFGILFALLTFSRSLVKESLREVCESQWMKRFWSRSNYKVTAGVNGFQSVSSCKTIVNIAMWHLQGQNQGQHDNWRFCKGMTNSHPLLKSYGHRKATCWVADIHILCQIWWRGFESRSEKIVCPFRYQIHRSWCGILILAICVASSSNKTTIHCYTFFKCAKDILTWAGFEPTPPDLE